MCQWLRIRWTGETHVRVLPDLVNDVLVKVARVAEDGAANVVGVLETLKDAVDKGELGALGEAPLLHDSRVQVLNPLVVLSSEVVRHVLLEHDDVRVGNVLSIVGRQQRSDALVNNLGLEHGRSRRQQRQGQKGEGTLHDDEMRGLEMGKSRRWTDRGL